MGLNDFVVAALTLSKQWVFWGMPENCTFLIDKEADNAYAIVTSDEPSKEKLPDC